MRRSGATWLAVPHSMPELLRSFGTSEAGLGFGSLFGFLGLRWLRSRYREELLGVCANQAGIISPVHMILHYTPVLGLSSSMALEECQAT